LKKEEDEEADGAGKLNSNGPFFSTSNLSFELFYHHTIRKSESQKSPEDMVEKSSLA